MAASRVTVHFPCPVERVWQTVTDLMNTAWRGDLARVEILNETHFVAIRCLCAEKQCRLSWD